MTTINLILVPESSICDMADFHVIAEKIRKSAPDIRVQVIRRRHLWWRQLQFLFSPSFYVAFYEARNFKPIRGICLHGKAMGKSEQYLRMQKVEIDVIPWQKIAPGERYSSSIWGNPVIVKPDRGREGRDVHLSKPENIALEKTVSDGQSWLIQKFIESGENPTYFRALSLFGEILYLRKTTNTASQIGRGSDDILPNPVANAAHGRAELVYDTVVIAFARKVAEIAFPEIPLLGLDIIRDRETGRLFCLEVNPYGSTWHFSTPTGLALQHRENFSYLSQFDAFTIASQILIKKARLLAR